jgi:hypothetical protein
VGYPLLGIRNCIEENNSAREMASEPRLLKKVVKFLALGSFITASLLSLVNIIMGIQLTLSASQDSSSHLAIALSVAALHLLGSLFMMTVTKKKFLKFTRRTLLK